MGVLISRTCAILDPAAVSCSHSCRPSLPAPSPPAPRSNFATASTRISAGRSTSMSRASASCSRIKKNKAKRSAI